jgi:PhoPQ-activated pathogenicity-related protein
VLAIEDPYGYRQRDRLGIPKLLVNATGDQFFLPDNWQFYYREMPGEKHLYYVPNAKHDLADSDGAAVALAFYQMVLAGRTRPSYDWTKGEDGSLEVRCETAPTEVNLWQATNAQARDFRVDAIGKAFTKSTLAPSAEGVYRAAVPPPTSGYTAFFVEMTFPSGGSYPLKVTTGVSVVPDVLPFDWKNALKQYAP